MTPPLRRPCSYTTPNAEAYSAWPAADKLHAIVGGFAEAYSTYLNDTSQTEAEWPEKEYRLQQLTDLPTIETAIEAARNEVVRNARLCGATWTEIGEALGVSRQAAQMRFGSKK